MLEQLIVKDFALSLDNTLDFEQGMTSITGETGAGKSLTVDAVSMLMGARAESQMVRTGAAKAELNAIFSIKNNEAARSFLEEHDLSSDDDELMLRRVISADGKSKSYINNVPCTLSWLKELGASLVAIHGQHASVKLIDKDNQLNLVDGFASLQHEVSAVNEAFEQYNLSRRKLQELADEQQAGAANYKNLKFELDALTKLDLRDGDYEKLSADYDALQHQAQAQDAVALALGMLEDQEHNIIDIISERISDLSKVAVYAKDSIEPIVDDLSKAAEHLDYARDALNTLTLKANPALVEELSEKLSKCHEFARRFNVQPQELYKVRERLEKELEHFLSLKEDIARLTANVKKLRDNYEKLASDLSKLRADAAVKMSEQVTSKIRELAMPDGGFKVSVVRDEECRPRRGGRDNVEFLFTANKGEPLKELGAVASGGELSRLALAIEVLTSKSASTQTLIFDEVDTGISGRTASSVGSLLRQLGKSVQVITVTHLPQVAASAHSQFLVSKQQHDSSVSSTVEKLDTRGRIEELSRMMGGNVVTDATRESAKALLKQSSE